MQTVFIYDFATMHQTDRHKFTVRTAHGFVMLTIKTFAGLPYPVLDIVLDYPSLEQFRLAGEETIGTNELVSKEFRQNVVPEMYTSINFKADNDRDVIIIMFPGKGRTHGEMDHMTMPLPKYKELVEVMYNHIDRNRTIDGCLIDPYVHV